MLKRNRKNKEKNFVKLAIIVKVTYVNRESTHQQNE